MIKEIFFGVLHWFFSLLKFTVDEVILFLKLIGLFLVVFSIYYLVVSFGTSTYDNTIPVISTLEYIYDKIAKFSGLYQTTGLFLGFLATLISLKHSFKTSEHTLRVDTIKHVHTFLKLTKGINYISNRLKNKGLPVRCTELTDYTREEANQKYCNSIFKKLILDSILQDDNVLNTFNDIELFSSIFIYTDLDNELGRVMFGSSYVNEMEKLLGLISYCRKDEYLNFMGETIKLYKEWKPYVKDIP